MDMAIITNNQTFPVFLGKNESYHQQKLIQ